ncbi:MAG: lysophospholipid acyltransferase family protein [Planctomycetaceae bacterium]
MSLNPLRWIAHLAEALPVYLAAAFFCLLPRRLAHHIGRRLGFYAYFVWGRARRVALENVKLVLGLEGREASRVARDSMKSAGAAIADLLRAPRMRRRIARRDLEIPEETWRAIDAIRRGGKGAVFACSHFGNWEFANLSGPYSALPPTTVVIRPVPNPLLGPALFWFRSRTGQMLILRSGAALECMQRVREGECCAITFDLPVPPDAGAAPVDFFGLPTYTTLGVGYVAAMTRAPVYLVHVLRLAGCRYRLVFRGPLEAPIGETLKATALATTRLVSQALEQAIREAPGQWAWWLKRWRIRPTGAKATFPSYSVDERYLWPTGKPPTRD